MSSYSRPRRGRFGRGRVLLPRSARLPLLVIATALLLAVVGIAPIVAGILGGSRGTAASQGLGPAAAGLYAIVIEVGEADDVVVGHPVAGGPVAEVARIPHLPGYGAIGTVSPDERLLALVVADAGTAVRPGASLLVVTLESGEVHRLATGVDPLQSPVWSADSGFVVAARQSGDGPGVTVSLFQVPAAGGPELQLVLFSNVLGAYPIALSGGGAVPLSVVIDSRGSTLYRGAAELVRLSDAITRDWRLSPDGTSIAFIEANTTAGLRYRQRVVSLATGVAAQAPETEGQQLGVAWNPADGSPRFGREPGTAAAGGAAGQRSSGFDVPLAYSPDGSALAVQEWDGPSFKEPGAMRLAILVAGARAELSGAARFLGWSTR